MSSGRRRWRENQALREDAAAGFAILRGHPATGVLTVTTLLAGVILAGVLAHVITD